MAETDFARHDHSTCIATGLARAERICAARSLRLTPVRRRVLEILLGAHRAMGAYEVLEQLRADGRAAQPPVAYRALDFLVEHGLAHKIERLNAFVACANSGREHAPVFLICRACGTVAETGWQPLAGEIGAAASARGFAVEAVVAEALGTCPNCREATAP